MPEVFIFFLVASDGDRVTFLTSSIWERSTDQVLEVRRASSVGMREFNDAMVKLDRSVKVLRDANDYWTFLGSEGGWAAIEPALAQTIMPQWLTAGECCRIRIAADTEIFVDKFALFDVILSTQDLRLFGTEIVATDWVEADNLVANLLLNRCSVS